MGLGQMCSLRRYRQLHGWKARKDKELVPLNSITRLRGGRALTHFEFYYLVKPFLPFSPQLHIFKISTILIQLYFALLQLTYTFRKPIS